MNPTGANRVAPRIAVLGAGPIGVEAALYGRYLGYDVEVFERGAVAQNMLDWGHVRAFTPFRMNRSSLGLAALTAQDPAWQPPDDDALLTGSELVTAYFAPLAKTDLLADRIHLNTRVVAMGRAGLLKGDAIHDAARCRFPFRILTQTDGKPGEQQVHWADVVIDATGTYGQSNWVGQGGVPAVGEQAAAATIDYRLPDVLDRDRHLYAGRHVLLVGGGFSAATTAVALAELAGSEPGTRTTWVTRRELGSDTVGPVPRIPDDPLAERDALAQAANALASADHASLTHWPGTTVDKIQLRSAGSRSPEQNLVRVELSGQHAGQLDVDRIVAHVGYRPDLRLYEELQVHTCYATDGPMKLAAALLADTATDCLDQTTHGPESLQTTEPGFYVLGAKSYGRRSQFLISLGLAQICELYSLIAESPDLDVYRAVRHVEASS